MRLLFASDHLSRCPIRAGRDQQHIVSDANRHPVDVERAVERFDGHFKSLRSCRIALGNVSNTRNSDIGRKRYKVRACWRHAGPDTALESCDNPRKPEQRATFQPVRHHRITLTDVERHRRQTTRPTSHNTNNASLCSVGWQTSRGSGGSLQLEGVAGISGIHIYR